MLRLLTPLGERGVDRHRWTLLQRVQEDLAGLASLEMHAWKRQNFLSGLHGFEDEARAAGLRVYQTGAHCLPSS